MDDQAAESVDGEPRKSRGFSLKMLLYAFASIPVGIGFIAWLFRTMSFAGFNPLHGLLAWVVGGGLVFSGIGALFRRPMLGLAIGFGLQAALLALAFMILITQPHIVG